jgi:thiol-disulfide isomerase/thioredoxin
MLSFERILSKNELEAVTLHVMTLAPTRAELLAPQIQKAGLRLVAKRGPAPNFSMTDMKGAKHQIQHYSGKVVIMSFWATSCAPCIAKMPDLEAMAKKHQPDGLCVLPVCVGEPDLDVVAHAIEGRISELEALIDDGLGAVKYDVQSTPTTVVIDRDGSLIARAEGALDWTSPEMLALIQSMLKP